VVLHDSDIKTDYDRAATEEAPLSVWREVIERFPEYIRWVAHNKTAKKAVRETFEPSTHDSMIRDAKQRGCSRAFNRLIAKLYLDMHMR
jgi:hypothetical protein